MIITCPGCGSQLADERGGKLIHHADGGHTYVPPGTSSQAGLASLVGLTVRPVVPAVQRVIEQWSAAHVADLERRLAPFGVSPSEIIQPTYHRLVREHVGGGSARDE
jgi:hypothetical protein